MKPMVLFRAWSDIDGVIGIFSVSAADEVSRIFSVSTAADKVNCIFSVNTADETAAFCYSLNGRLILKTCENVSTNITSSAHASTQNEILY